MTILEEEKSKEVFTGQLETETPTLEVGRQQKCDGARGWEAKKVSTNLVRTEMTILEEDKSRTHSRGDVRWRGLRIPGCVPPPKQYEGGESGDKAKGWVGCGADMVQPNTPENQLPSREEGGRRMERKKRTEKKKQEWLDNYFRMEWLEASASLEEGKVQGGWKNEEALERLVKGKWEGKRKIYEKGRWSDNASMCDVISVTH